MSTTVTYNGVVIRDVLTEDVSFQTISDPTGVDPLYTEVTVQVRGTVHTQDLSATVELSHHGLSVWETAGSNLPQGIAIYCEALMQPRKVFHMTIGGKTLFLVWPSRVPGTGGAYNKRNEVKYNAAESPGNRPDINNGPRTKVRVHNIIGGVSATIGLTVTFCIEQQTPSQVRQRAMAGITNLRWWFSEDITGRDNTTVRTTHGRIRVVNHDVNVHYALRVGYVLPPLQGGFHRKSVHITENPNGLEAEFTVIDEEVHLAPPAPATWWDVRHRISSPTVGGAIVESDMTVDLMAPKNVDKRDLVTLAIKIIDTKTHLLESLAAADPGVSGAILMSAHFEDHCTDGRLSAAVRFRHHPQSQDSAGTVSNSKTFLNTLKEEFGKRITAITGYTYDGVGYNPDKSHVMFQTATAVGLYRALLQTSDYPVEMPQTAAVLGTPDEEGEAYNSQVDGKEVEVTVTAEPLEDWNTNYSQAHERYPFMSQSVESELRTPSGSIVLPVAGGSALPGSRVVSLHRPFCTRRITMDCERVDRPPTLLTDASFVDDGATHTLLSKNETPISPILSVDGRHTIYRVLAAYVFALDKVPTDIPYGKVQWHNGSLASIPKVKGATSGAIA